MIATIYTVRLVLLMNVNHASRAEVPRVKEVTKSWLCRPSFMVCLITLRFQPKLEDRLTKAKISLHELSRAEIQILQ